MSCTAITAFFNPPSLATSIVLRKRLSPSINSLCGFLGQNFGFGNLENRNSFCSDLPLYVTLPVTVPPAKEESGAIKNAPIRTPDMTMTLFFMRLPPCDRNDSLVYQHAGAPLWGDTDPFDSLAPMVRPCWRAVLAGLRAQRRFLYSSSVKCVKHERLLKSFLFRRVPLQRRKDSAERATNRRSYGFILIAKCSLQDRNFR